jgi:hypothetical protein
MTEIELMSSLEASAGRMIYWARKTVDELKACNTRETAVKLLRNQAKFSLEVSDDVDFTENELIDLNIEEDVIPEEWGGSDSVSEPEVAQTDEEDVTSDPEEVSELDSDSVQESESLETPEPEAAPVPESENIAESEPEAAPVPESEDSLEEESVSESASESETEVVLESEQESEQSAAPASAADSVSVPIPTESVNTPEKSLPVPKKPAEPSTSNKVLKAILISLICVFALAVIYMLVMRIFPDFMNNVLYTPEELEIINFK